MSKGARFAFTLILFWLAFFMFYVAFHPGGILVPGKDPDADPNHDNLSVQVNGAAFHRARNPAEVVKHVILTLSAGPSGSPGGVTNA